MSNIRKHEHIIDGHILNFAAKLDGLFAATGQTFDLSSWTQYYTFDVVSHVAFGEAHGCIDAGGDKDGLIQATKNTVKGAFLVVALANTIYKVYKALPEKLANWVFIPTIDEDVGLGLMFKVGYRVVV